MEAQTKEDEVFAGLLGERKRKKKWDEMRVERKWRSR